MKKKIEQNFLHAWFAMTHHERLFLGGILLILLVGITARYFHLKNEKPERYDPFALEQVNPGDHP